MRRMEAKRKKASALTFRFSQSLASRRHRLSQAIVRSMLIGLTDIFEVSALAVSRVV